MVVFINKVSCRWSEIALAGNFDGLYFVLITWTTVNYHGLTW